MESSTSISTTLSPTSPTLLSPYPLLPGSLGDLPPDVLYSIALRLSPNELFNFCRVSRKFQTICQRRTFWEEKAELDFEVPPEEFNRQLSKSPYLTPLDIYVSMASERGICTIYSIKMRNLTYCLRYAYETDDQVLLQYLTAMYGDTLEMVAETSYYGDLPRLKRVVKDYLKMQDEEIPDPVKGLRLPLLQSALQGQDDIFSYLMSLTSFPEIDLEVLRRRFPDILTALFPYFTIYYSSYPGDSSPFTLDDGLILVARRGHANIAYDLINRGANPVEAIIPALRFNNQEVLDYLIDYFGVPQILNYVSGSDRRDLETYLRNFGLIK